jgi:hypothetical protein
MPGGVLRDLAEHVQNDLRTDEYQKVLRKVTCSPDILEASWQLTDEFCAQAGGSECYPAMLTASGPLSIATLYLPDALACGDILLGFTTYSETEEIDRVMPLPCWTGKNRTSIEELMRMAFIPQGSQFAFA